MNFFSRRGTLPEGWGPAEGLLYSRLAAEMQEVPSGPVVLRSTICYLYQYPHGRGAERLRTSALLPSLRDYPGSAASGAEHLSRFSHTAADEEY